MVLNIHWRRLFLSECLWPFIARFLDIHLSDVLTALFGYCMACNATWNCCIVWCASYLAYFLTIAMTVPLRHRTNFMTSPRRFLWKHRIPSAFVISIPLRHHVHFTAPQRAHLFTSQVSSLASVYRFPYTPCSVQIPSRHRSVPSCRQSSDRFF